MRFILFILILLPFACDSQSEYSNSRNRERAKVYTEPSIPSVKPLAKEIKLLTWNLFNFGKSKDAKEIDFMADIMKDFDVIAIQEISTKKPGAQAVARLVDALNRRGFKWDYKVSDPTTGAGSERYAYLWKPSRVKLVGKPWLSSVLAKSIDREPYMARFSVESKKMLLASLHAIPTAKKPSKEIKLLYKLHKKYKNDNILIMGDFNLSEKKPAWNKLKKAGYKPCITGKKTSLKMKKKKGEHLSKEYDNIFYEASSFNIIESGVIDFSKKFRTLKKARSISDHIPVYITFQL